MNWLRRGGLTTLAILLLSPVSQATPFSVGSALSHENLTVFPLYHADGQSPPDDFLTFEEASRAKTVEVTELDGNTEAAEVNSVHVTNSGDRPIFIMAGEVILGGKQDRVVGKSTIVEPRTQKQVVEVFCVEQGRWNGNTAQFKVSGKMGHSALRDKANFASSQGEVWQEVAKTNAANQAETQSDTYRATLEQSQNQFRVDAYKLSLLPPLSADSKAVGIAVAIGGKVIAVDAFANPKLFGKVRDKILESYAVDAAAHPSAGSVSTADKAEVETFLTKASGASDSKTLDSGGAANYFFEGDEIQGVRTAPKDAKPAAKAVHTYMLAL